jgi:hypothetical protein
MNMVKCWICYENEAELFGYCLQCHHDTSTAIKPILDEIIIAAKQQEKI